MPTLADFLSHFDADGRFRDGDGGLDVIFTIEPGRQYRGRLTFQNGLCVAADMEGSMPWSYPDGSPLDGVRFHLLFDQRESVFVVVGQGRVLRTDTVPTPDTYDLSTRPNVQINPRAHTALLSLSQRERGLVLAAVDQLAKTPPAEWPADIALRLNADNPVHLVWVSSTLRAFVRPIPKGGVEVFDLVSESTLRKFLERSKVGSGAA